MRKSESNATSLYHKECKCPIWEGIWVCKDEWSISLSVVLCLHSKKVCFSEKSCEDISGDKSGSGCRLGSGVGITHSAFWACSIMSSFISSLVLRWNTMVCITVMCAVWGGSLLRLARVRDVSSSESVMKLFCRPFSKRSVNAVTGSRFCKRDPQLRMRHWCCLPTTAGDVPIPMSLDSVLKRVL